MFVVQNIELTLEDVFANPSIIEIKAPSLSSKYFNCGRTCIPAKAPFNVFR